MVMVADLLQNEASFRQVRRALFHQALQSSDFLQLPEGVQQALRAKAAKAQSQVEDDTRRGIPRNAAAFPSLPKWVANRMLEMAKNYTGPDKEDLPMGPLPQIMAHYITGNGWAARFARLPRYNLEPIPPPPRPVEASGSSTVVDLMEQSWSGAAE